MYHLPATPLKVLYKNLLKHSLLKVQFFFNYLFDYLDTCTFVEENNQIFVLIGIFQAITHAHCRGLNFVIIEICYIKYSILPRDNLQQDDQGYLQEFRLSAL